MIVKNRVRLFVGVKCSGTCVQGTLMAVFFVDHVPEGQVSRLTSGGIYSGMTCVSAGLDVVDVIEYLVTEM